MALFSDIDWVIVVAVAAFLLFGRGNTEVLRTMGRWYGRAGRLKQDLLSEFTKAADLPAPGGTGALSFRGALLGLDPPVAHRSGIPTAVSTAPVPPTSPSPNDGFPLWSVVHATPTWSMTVPVTTDPNEVAR